MNKRILITGSAGFVGSHVVDHFIKNTDWDIIGLDSFRHRGDSLRVTDEMDAKRYTVHCCDLSAPISDRLAEKIGHVDYIFNMASESHVDRSITDPVPFVQNNVNLSLNMLEYARKVKPRTFIQMSTDEVYGAAPKGISHAEWSPILPSNPYAASKAAQEAIAISYWRTYGTHLQIVNCMNLFGSRQDKEKFIPMLISKISKGETVTIHGNEDFIGSRFYIHSRNFADGVLWLIKNTEPKSYFDSSNDVIFPDRYNIVGEIELNNLDVAKKIAAILKKPLHFNLQDFHQARPGHDRRYALDGSKINKMGWKQPISFDESLEQTVKWTIEHPEWI